MRPRGCTRRAPTTVAEVRRRLFEILDVIESLARLEFAAKAQVGPKGDVIDAMAAGVNMLGEELSAFSDEVDARAAALTQANEELERHAIYDSLTGLPNRYLIRRRLEAALQADSGISKLAVLSIDLDGFKDVNDSLGHAAGDRVLVEVGERLRGAVRPHDTAGRIGGDE